MYVRVSRVPLEGMFQRTLEYDVGVVQEPHDYRKTDTNIIHRIYWDYYFDILR